jgi:tellurite resistance protein TehA-like permease
MIPGILGIALLTDRVAATLRSPDWQSLLTLFVVAALVLTAGYLLSRQLLRLAKNKTGDADKKPARQNNSEA